MATADHVTMRATTRIHAAGELNVVFRSCETDFIIGGLWTDPFLRSKTVVVVVDE